MLSITLKNSLLVCGNSDEYPQNSSLLATTIQFVQLLNRHHQARNRKTLGLFCFINYVDNFPCLHSIQICGLSVFLVLVILDVGIRIYIHGSISPFIGFIETLLNWPKPKTKFLLLYRENVTWSEKTDMSVPGTYSLPLCYSNSVYL